MAELADAPDSKSGRANPRCGFDSHHRHHFLMWITWILHNQTGKTMATTKKEIQKLIGKCDNDNLDDIVKILENLPYKYGVNISFRKLPSMYHGVFSIDATSGAFKHKNVIIATSVVSKDTISIYSHHYINKKNYLAGLRGFSNFCNRINHLCKIANESMNSTIICDVDYLDIVKFAWYSYDYICYTTVGRNRDKIHINCLQNVRNTGLGNTELIEESYRTFSTTKMEFPAIKSIRVYSINGELYGQAKIVNICAGYSQKLQIDIAKKRFLTMNGDEIKFSNTNSLFRDIKETVASKI